MIYRNCRDLLDDIRAKGHRPIFLGAAPDGSPIVAIQSGGDREPAVFISAGSHSTEQAGVTAAVELIDELETEHQVYVVPTRDPIGMNGYDYALSLGLGEEVRIESIEELDTILRERGEVLWEEDDVILSLIGEYGFANHGMLGRLGPEHAEAVEPLKGRRIFTVARKEGIEGAAPLERAYTLIVDPLGEVLHINRFHDTAWAPAEPRCTRQLMARIRPGISFDLHEHGGSGRFWLSARHQRDDEGEEWENQIAQQVIGAIGETGVELAREDEVGSSFFTRSQRGVYWLDAGVRGQGVNLMDFAARTYGLAFGTEMGMLGSFQQRVRLGKLVVQTAVRGFEERYS